MKKKHLVLMLLAVFFLSFFLSHSYERDYECEWMDAFIAPRGCDFDHECPYSCSCTEYDWGAAKEVEPGECVYRFGQCEGKSGCCSRIFYLGSSCAPQDCGCPDD